MTTVDQLIVITGGPGSGKTTLVRLLRDAGFDTAPEAGRAIIQDQTAIGGPALPWLDPVLFAELMVSWDMRSHRWARARGGPVFFDQGLPGMPGYYRLIGRPVPAHVEAAVATYRYQRRVFVAPPWPEIYRNDAERRQDLDEAGRTHDAVVDAVIRSGYEPVELPRAAPRTRLEFVLDEVGLARPADVPEAGL